MFSELSHYINFVFGLGSLQFYYKFTNEKKHYQPESKMVKVNVLISCMWYLVIVNALEDHNAQWAKCEVDGNFKARFIMVI